MKGKVSTRMHRYLQVFPNRTEDISFVVELNNRNKKLQLLVVSASIPKAKPDS